LRSFSFDVKDKTYTLRYNFNAVCDLEEEAGYGIQTLFDPKKVGLNIIRLLIWAGLKWQDRGITKQRAGEILNLYIEQGGDYSELVNKASELLLTSVTNDKMKQVETAGE